MIAEKLLGCIAPAAQVGFLATWNGAAGSAPAADIGAVNSVATTSTGSGTIIVSAGSGMQCTITSLPMSQNAWVIDMFFMVDGANLAPPIFFVLFGGQNVLTSMYLGTLSVFGNAIDMPSMSAGLHHLAFGLQSGGYSAWIDGARVIYAAAPPQEPPGEISLSMYGAGVSSISSYPCEWGNVRATAGELYSGPTISVPTLPLVAV